MFIITQKLLNNLTSFGPQGDSSAVHENTLNLLTKRHIKLSYGQLPSQLSKHNLHDFHLHVMKLYIWILHVFMT